MISQNLFAARNLLFKLAVFCASLLWLYGLFIGVTAVWVGLNHRHQQGFWAPVLAGALFIALIAWLYFRLVFAVRRALKRSDSIYL